MRSKYLFAALVTMLLTTAYAEAQTIIVPGRGGYYRQRPRRMVKPRPQNMRQQPQLPKFEPTVNLSFGYGFPNLDKDYLPEYYNAYSGSVNQTGPITGSVDYRFSRNMSIGATVMYGKVSAPYYYGSNNTFIPDFNAKLESWAFMLNLKSYIPTPGKVSPYFRGSIGVNTWDQTYTDASGKKLNMPEVDLPDLAYQVGVGAEFKLSKNAGFFAEAGYGKYILHGGLMFKF